MANVFTKNCACHLRRLDILKYTTLENVTASHIRLTKTGPYSTSTSSAVSVHEKEAGEAVKPFSEIPCPKGLPIVGSLFEIPVKTNEQMAFLQKRCNDLFPIHKSKVFKHEEVVLYDVEEIEKLVRNEAKYPQRGGMPLWEDYRRLSGNADGVLTCNHEKWHRMRKVIDKPMLRIKDVSGYADDVNEVVTDFLERLGNIRQTDGLVPDLERELFNWSLETIGKILYERRFGGLSDARDPELQRFIYAIKDMFLTSVQMFVFPMWLNKTVFRPLLKKHDAGWDTIFRVAKKCVDERMKEIADHKGGSGEKKFGVLSYLLEGNSLPVEEIYSNVTELMMGAVDTTSTATLWALQELSLHPEVQDKLLAEVTSVLPDGDLPTFQDLQKMPYLKAVVKETLRKYPVAAVYSRVLQEDRVICGYHVPAKVFSWAIAQDYMSVALSDWVRETHLQNMDATIEFVVLIQKPNFNLDTNITVFGHVMGRLPQYYEDPEEFRPERWLRRSGEKPNPYLFVAFGFGTRMCVGRRVAELEMYTFLSRLIRKFSIEPGFTEPAKEAMELVLRPDRPIKIMLIDRN